MLSSSGCSIGPGLNSFLHLGSPRGGFDFQPHARTAECINRVFTLSDHSLELHRFQFRKESFSLFLDEFLYRICDVPTTKTVDSACNRVIHPKSPTARNIEITQDVIVCGVYFDLSLWCNLDEQAFRFNKRKATDFDRFREVLSMVTGKRLEYKKLYGASRSIRCGKGAFHHREINTAE